MEVPFIADSNSSSTATKKQLDIMEGQLEQIRVSSRACVGCRGGSCAPIASNEPFEVTLILKNTGETPANRVKIGIAAHMGEKDCDIESIAAGRTERAVTDIPTSSTIPPAIEITAPHFVAGIKDADLAMIKEGTLVLYVFGEVVYDDVFRERHMTRYCFIVDPKTWKTRTYRQYNEMQ